MGGWLSGSARRSYIATTEGAFTLSMTALKAMPAIEHLRRALEADQGAVVELEINATESGYRLRPWIGTRTRFGLPDSPGEVERPHWLAETSMFVALTATRIRGIGVEQVSKKPCRCYKKHRVDAPVAMVAIQASLSTPV